MLVSIAGAIKWKLPRMEIIWGDKQLVEKGGKSFHVLMSG